MPLSIAPEDQTPVRFQLTRYFSLTSLLGLAIVTLVLLFALNRLAERQLIEHEDRANTDQTRAFANALWDGHRDFVNGTSPRTSTGLLGDPRFTRLDRDVRARMHGLHIAKVKIYDARGLTIYSTDAAQVGENQRDNPGVQSALMGRSLSEITFRESFDAIEGHLDNRNLIASYVPVQGGPQNGVEGVFEVYSDVTDLLERQRRRQWQVAAMVLALLATLYAFLYLVVRKADGILAGQAGDAETRERHMRHQAFHDPLTSLPNRAAFQDQMRHAIALATRRGHTTALMFIDLDRFKLVNDSLGHLTGDALLKLAGQRIGACLRGSDQLYRMGGDEFTVILPEVTASEDVAVVARRILEAMALPATVHEHEMSVGASIGIAVFPGDGPDAETLLKNADAAMYTAKSAGRGQFAFYQPEMHLRAQQRLDLDVALKKAEREGDFTLRYRPRVDARTRQVVAVEALMRWDRPGHGLLDLAPFRHTLEESGLMDRLGPWMLREACAQARRWRQQGMPTLRVALAASAHHLASHSFADDVRQALADNSLDGSNLEFILPDTLLAERTGIAREQVASLKALGVRLVIDDQACGPTALARLREWQVDALRFDPAAIALPPERRADAIRALVQLARTMDMDVVVAGITSEIERDRHVAAGCAELQGPLFGEPMPAAQLSASIATRSTGAAPA